MKPVSELYEPMRGYFTRVTNLAKQKGSRYGKEIASDAGLCMEIGITKAQLVAMQFGTEEEKQFYGEYLLQFEICANAMRSSSMITDKEHLDLKKKFEDQGPESDKVINVIFPNWNAPDNYEDYLEIEAIAKENGLSIRQLKKVLINALKGVAK
jgi:hypothetical protein